jgi:hypothetical protein
MDELDDEDCEDDLESKKSNKTEKKRKLKENLDDSETSSKKSKKTSQLAVKRESSAQVKIEGIKQLLINEIQSLENGWPIEEFIEIIKEQTNESFNKDTNCQKATTNDTESIQFDQSSHLYYTNEILNQQQEKSSESPLEVQQTTAETIINECNLDYEEQYFDENILGLIAENNQEFYSSFQDNINCKCEQEDLKSKNLNFEHVIKHINYDETDFGFIPSEEYNICFDQQEDGLIYYNNYNCSF